MRNNDHLPTIFTPQQQAEHCRQLADLLASDRVKGHYNQAYFTNLRFGEVEADTMHGTDEEAFGDVCGTVACACGWAGAAGIGGMKVDPFGDPYLETADGSFFHTYAAGDIVFGDGASERIFMGHRPEADATLDAQFGIEPGDDPEDVLEVAELLKYRDGQREVSIELLRNQAALLETQPELA
jgi:hypothetical protein